jgi:hypothetical protein
MLCWWIFDDRIRMNDRECDIMLLSLYDELVRRINTKIKKYGA